MLYYFEVSDLITNNSKYITILAADLNLESIIPGKPKSYIVSHYRSRSKNLRYLKYFKFFFITRMNVFIA